MQIPGLIKDRVMTRFHNVGSCVQVNDVLVSGRIPKEDSREVVMVEFASMGAGALHANARAECFEICDIRFATIPTFEGGYAGHRVDEAVVEVHSVKECRGPELRREAQAVEERAYLNRERVVVYFGTAIL